MYQTDYLFDRCFLFFLINRYDAFAAHRAVSCQFKVPVVLPNETEQKSSEGNPVIFSRVKIEAFSPHHPD